MTSRYLLNSLGALLLGLTLMHTSIQPAHAARVQEVDRIVAIVDEDVVVLSELRSETKKILIQLRERGGQLPPPGAIERQVLERLILKKLQLAAAGRAGITVGEEMLAQAINNVARKNNMTISQLRQALAQEGVSFRSYRDDVRDQLILQRLQDQEIRRKIRISEQEVNAFIARQGSELQKRSAYRLLHILVATPEAASAEQIDSARNKALRLVSELRAGADFGAIALTESDGRQALEGGDLGWLPTRQIPTIFSKTIATMERGEISDPVHTPSGYHIIKLDDYKGGERLIITQTHARHILIRTNEITSDEDARTRLEQLKQRIDGGDDFTALARSHSDDKSSAIKGGDLGWTTPGDLLPRFEEEMEKLGPGQLSEPFRTDFGWHLVQVLERRQHDSTQEVQKAEAHNALQKRKLEEETELYLRRLRDEAYVDILLDEL